MRTSFRGARRGLSPPCAMGVDFGGSLHGGDKPCRSLGVSPIHNSTKRSLRSRNPRQRHALVRPAPQGRLGLLVLAGHLQQPDLTQRIAAIEQREACRRSPGPSCRSRRAGWLWQYGQAASGWACGAGLQLHSAGLIGEFLELVQHERQAHALRPAEPSPGLFAAGPPRAQGEGQHLGRMQRAPLGFLGHVRVGRHILDGGADGARNSRAFNQRRLGASNT